MPTILRTGSLRVVVYPNDHRPAHVHVMGDSDEAVFELNAQKVLSNCGRIMGFRHAS